MKNYFKNYLWLAGLGATGLLFLNIIFQLNFHKDHSAEIKISDSSQPRETNKRPLASRMVLPIEVTKSTKPDLPKLELLGTIMGNTAMAFIFDPQTESSGLYKVNDQVGDFKLSQISAGKIVLEKDGVTHELFLASNRARAAKENESFVARDDSGTMIISKFQLIGQMFKANELISKIKIMPLAGDVPNKLRGFKIENVPSGSMIEEIGIKNGDVIYSVQGQRLQSMPDALAMFNRIQSQSRIEVVLLRNDQPITLKYEIK